MLIALLLALATSQPTGLLDRVAAELRSAPCWRADFEQRYVPAGFDTGATDRGHLTLVHPGSLRFDYEGEQGRLFATDGSVARYLDLGAVTCTAVRIDATTWGKLPLAAVLDPGAARAAFAIEGEGRRLTLTPHQTTPELARVEVEIGPDGLPASVTIVDGSGNHNGFALSRWERVDLPDASFFRPALPGAAACEPVEE